MKLNFKLIIGIIYLVCLSALLFYVFSNFDIRDLTSLTYIRQNSKYLVEFKDNNIAGKLEKDSDLFEAMEKFPKIMERPIIVSDLGAVIGRPPENVLKVLET